MSVRHNIYMAKGGQLEVVDRKTVKKNIESIMSEIKNILNISHNGLNELVNPVLFYTTVRGLCL